MSIAHSILFPLFMAATPRSARASLNARQPEALIYEFKDGTARLVACEGQ